MVRVKFYGIIRNLAATEELSLSIEERIRLQELLDRVIPHNDEHLGRQVSAILINGRNCAFRDGLETFIEDGDLIEILPIVSGG